MLAQKVVKFSDSIDSQLSNPYQDSEIVENVQSPYGDTDLEREQDQPSEIEQLTSERAKFDEERENFEQQLQEQKDGFK